MIGRAKAVKQNMPGKIAIDNHLTELRSEIYPVRREWSTSTIRDKDRGRRAIRYLLKSFEPTMFKAGGAFLQTYLMLTVFCERQVFEIILEFLRIRPFRINSNHSTDDNKDNMERNFLPQFYRHREVKFQRFATKAVRIC